MTCIHAARYWMCTPEMLLPILAELDVPMADRRVWLCTCGDERCMNAVAYGVGTPRGDAAWVGEGPVPTRVLWMIPSCKFIEHKVPISGLGPGETIDQMLEWQEKSEVEGLRLQGQWWRHVLDGLGFREVAEAALRDLASRHRVELAS